MHDARGCSAGLYVDKPIVSDKSQMGLCAPQVCSGHCDDHASCSCSTHRWTPIVHPVSQIRAAVAAQMTRAAARAMEMQKIDAYQADIKNGAYALEGLVGLIMEPLGLSGQGAARHWSASQTLLLSLVVSPGACSSATPRWH